MSAALRVLDVIQSLDPALGGPAEGLRQISAALQRLGHASEVLSLDCDTDGWVRAFPATVHALGPRHGRFGYAHRLVPWLREHAGRYDAVVVHGLWQYHGLATWRALRGSGVPYFVFPHGMLDPWFRRAHPLKHLKKWLYWPWAEYRVLRDAAGVLFTTAEEARLAPQSFALYRARPLTVGYGLTLDPVAHDARAEDFLQAWPALQGCRLLLFLGRLHPKKGCDQLIEAFARHGGRDERLHLVMAGPDANGYRSLLERLARSHGIEHRITWTGMLQGQAKWGALRAAEVFVLPSHQENFGVAVAEALAVGTPVLLSREVNIWREIIEDGAGFAEADTVEGTTALLGRWLDLDDSARSQMAARAQPCFAGRFQVDAAARALTRAFATARERRPDSQR